MGERRLGFRRRLTIWIIGGLGSGLAALVVGAMAILNTHPKGIPDLDPGRPFETGQWHVVPLAAYATSEEVHHYPLNDRSALVLEAQVTNRTGETSSDYQTLFQPDFPLDPRDMRPTVVLIRDFTGMTVSGLHPGLSERVAFVWMLPQGAQTPPSIRVVVNTKHYKAMDNLKGLPGWFNQEPLGKLTMAIAPVGGRAAP
ncbi:hypothetical protein [Rhizobium binxianense]